MRPSPRLPPRCRRSTRRTRRPSGRSRWRGRESRPPSTGATSWRARSPTIGPCRSSGANASSGCGARRKPRRSWPSWTSRSVLAKEEAEFMRSGDAVTEAERKAAEAERALEEVRERQAPLREALAGKREQIAAERERAFAERERATAGVTPGLLARYERIRRGKAPLALYALHGDACGHCFTAVPTQRRALIQRGATIEGCEACGVLLYASE